MESTQTFGGGAGGQKKWKPRELPDFVSAGGRAVTCQGGILLLLGYMAAPRQCISVNEGFL